MRRFHVTRNALSASDFGALRDALLRSPLLGRSTLAGPFQGTRGFAVIFRDEGRGKVLERFPALHPYLNSVLGKPSVRALSPWWKRKYERTPNAWYLNVLLVSEGATVTRHVDATLRKPSGAAEAVPEVVSVLYLKVPSTRGGELRLWEGPRAIAKVRPVENRVVHFRGSLAHEVLAFEGATDALRVSLVIEQYHFEPSVLARLPAFQLDSRAGFSAHLEHHAQRSF